MGPVADTATPAYVRGACIDVRHCKEGGRSRELCSEHVFIALRRVPLVTDWLWSHSNCLSCAQPHSGTSLPRLLDWFCSTSLRGASQLSRLFVSVRSRNIFKHADHQHA